jgi:hypothetical protein
MSSEQMQRIRRVVYLATRADNHNNEKHVEQLIITRNIRGLR